MADNLPQLLEGFTAYAAPQVIFFNIEEATGQALPILSARIVRRLGIARLSLPGWLQPTTTSSLSSVLTVSFSVQQSETLIALARDSLGTLAMEYTQAGGVVLLQPINFSLIGETPNGTPYLVTVTPIDGEGSGSCIIPVATMADAVELVVSRPSDLVVAGIDGYGMTNARYMKMPDGGLYKIFTEKIN